MENMNELPMNWGSENKIREINPNKKSDSEIFQDSIDAIHERIKTREDEITTITQQLKNDALDASARTQLLNRKTALEQTNNGTAKVTLKLMQEKLEAALGKQAKKKAN